MSVLPCMSLIMEHCVKTQTSHSSNLSGTVCMGVFRSGWLALKCPPCVLSRPVALSLLCLLQRFWPACYRSEERMHSTSSTVEGRTEMGPW
jgi:hypothetical protein